MVGTGSACQRLLVGRSCRPRAAPPSSARQVPTAFFGLMRGASILQHLIPIEAGVGFLMWVGLQITAQGFEGDQTPEGWRHGPAVAIGLIPSISAWGWQTVATTFTATRNLLCGSLGSGSGGLHALRALTAVTNETAVGAVGGGWDPWQVCSMELHELIQEPNAAIVLGTPLTKFQLDVSALFLSGMYALANG